METHRKLSTETHNNDISQGGLASAKASSDLQPTQAQHDPFLPIKQTVLQTFTVCKMI